MHANWIYAGLKSFPPDTFIFMAKGLIYLGILLQANFYTNMATIIYYYQYCCFYFPLKYSYSSLFFYKPSELPLYL